MRSRGLHLATRFASLWLAAVPLVAGGCDRGIAFPDGGASWSVQPTPAWALMPRIAITDNGDDTLAFVSRDLGAPHLLGFLPVGDIPVELEGPHHLAASPDGSALYVGLSNYVPGSGTGPHGSHGIGTVPGSLLKIDAKSGAKLGEAVVDRNPGDVVLSKDGRTAYVSHFDRLRWINQQQNGLPAEAGYSSIAVVDTTTMARPPLYPVCPTGHGMQLTPDGKTLYVSCSSSDELAIFDVATHAARRVSVGPGGGAEHYFPYALAISPADGSVWLSCNNSADVRVFDPTLNGGMGGMDAARTQPVTGVPMFSAFFSDGKTIVVPQQQGTTDQLTIFDTSLPPSQRTLTTVPLNAEVCLNAHVVTLTPDDQWAYVVCEGDHTPARKGSIVAVQMARDGNGKIVPVVAGSAEVGVFPDSMAFLP